VDQHLRSDIDALLDRHQIPACAIAVTNRDGILWKQAFGTDCTLETQFHLFSGTKLYTAVAILQLVQDGKLASLKDDVTEYLPDFEPQLRGITLEHLLGHASGLRDTPMRAWLSVTFDGARRPTSGEMLRRFAFQRRAAPGVGPAAYANLNYVILGEVIERVTERKYEDYVKENVLDRLHSKACFSVREAATLNNNLAKGSIGFWNSLLVKLVLERDQYQSLFRGAHTIPKGQRGAGLYQLQANFDLDSPLVVCWAPWRTLRPC